MNFDNIFDDDFDFEDTALEAGMVYSLKKRFGDDKKQAAAMFKAAKQALKDGDFSTAEKNAKEAKKMYGQLIKDLAKVPDKEYQYSMNGTNKGMTKTIVKNYFAGKAFKCEELLEKIKKAKMGPSMESFLNGIDLDDDDATLESFLDGIAEEDEDGIVYDDEALESAIDSMFGEDDVAMESASLDDIIDGLDSIAMEGMFGTKPVGKVLEKFKNKVEKKCKTIEDCDDLIAVINAEGAELNSVLGQMKDLAKKYSTGDITKKELSDSIKPLAKQIKDKVTKLKLSDFVKSNKNVTDEELKNVKSFIVNAKKIVTAKKAALKA